MTAAHSRPSDTLQASRPIVLFDGACPLCRREIAHYRRLTGAETVDWIDLAAPNLEIPDKSITRAMAMARMHVRDRNGRWHTGAWAFAELWSHLKGYRGLSRLGPVNPI